MRTGTLRGIGLLMKWITCALIGELPSVAAGRCVDGWISPSALREAFRIRSRPCHWSDAVSVKLVTVHQKIVAVPAHRAAAVKGK